MKTRPRMKTLGHWNHTKIHKPYAEKTRPSMKILGNVNGTKIHNPSCVDPNLTYFTSYVNGTKAVKTRPSMKTLGHVNGT